MEKEGDGLEEVIGEEIALTATCSRKSFIVVFDQNNLLLIAANTHMLC